MKTAAIIAVLCLVCALIAWRIFRTPLKEGNFVAYRAQDGEVIHRLGEGCKGGFVVYGTANESSDFLLVTTANYIGRVAVLYRLVNISF